MTIMDETTFDKLAREATKRAWPSAGSRSAANKHRTDIITSSSTIVNPLAPILEGGYVLAVRGRDLPCLRMRTTAAAARIAAPTKKRRNFMAALYREAFMSSSSA